MYVCVLYIHIYLYTAEAGVDLVEQVAREADRAASVPLDGQAAEPNNNNNNNNNNDNNTNIE